MRAAAAYKRASEADGAAMVTLEPWRSDWTPAEAVEGADAAGTVPIKHITR